jgi:hypothetical protein
MNFSVQYRACYTADAHGILIVERFRIEQVGWPWWHRPVVPVISEEDTGESPEHMSLRPV